MGTTVHSRGTQVPRTGYKGYASPNLTVGAETVMGLQLCPSAPPAALIRGGLLDMTSGYTHARTPVLSYHLFLERVTEPTPQSSKALELFSRGPSKTGTSRSRLCITQWDASEDTAGRAFVLHVADPCSIPSIP